MGKDFLPNIYVSFLTFFFLTTLWTSLGSTLRSHTALVFLSSGLFQPGLLRFLLLVDFDTCEELRSGILKNILQ